MSTAIFVCPEQFDLSVVFPHQVIGISGKFIGDRPRYVECSRFVPKLKIFVSKPVTSFFCFVRVHSPVP